MPDSAFKRFSIRAPDYGLLYNLTHRVIPMSAILLFGILLCVVLAYSLNGRAVPRQYTVGTYITFGILAALFTILKAIYFCRLKCAGKHNLRLEPPAAEPVPVPEMAKPGRGGLGPGEINERTKQAAAVTRQRRESKAFGDLGDQIKHVVKEWLNKYYPYWHYRDGVRARAPAHAPRERGAPTGRYAPHNHYDTWIEETAEGEGMLARWRRSYLDLSDSEMTNAEAKDLYRRQRDRDCRGARADAQRSHQAHCESDDNRSQNLDNTGVEPLRAVQSQDCPYCNLPLCQMERAHLRKIRI